MGEVITGFLQEYPWGAPDGMSAVLPVNDERRGAGGPQAELWFGAHPRGPSPVRDEPGVSLVDRLPAPDSAPILVKLLAAGRPLSIQVHPSAALAAELLAAGDAGLSDDRAKEEMLISIAGFNVYCGMRDAAQTLALFTELARRVRRVPVLEAVAGQFARQLADPDPALGEPGWCAAVRLLLELTPDEVDAVVVDLAEAGRQVGVSDETIRAWAQTALAYPGDPGILVAAALDQRELRPGDCSYVPTGVVHAYIQGYGVEVMTSSDNVLRLGLTGKQIAVDEALSAVQTQASPQIIPGQRDAEGVIAYVPDGAPFDAVLSSGAELRGESGTYRVLLCIDGEVRAQVEGQQSPEVLTAGEALVLWGADPAVTGTVTGHAVLARAR